MERSNTISFIRMCSMIMIVACHILQYYDNEMAFWLNVGVPVFLILSGFLYGKKEAVGEKFYRKRLCKIIPEFWVFILCAIGAYMLVKGYSFSVSELARLIAGLPNHIAGLQHIWFVSTILLCYAITPFIYKGLKIVGG